jgi:PQQ-dependent dehydrogenase (methanol/ethanol family)
MFSRPTIAVAAAVSAVIALSVAGSASANQSTVLSRATADKQPKPCCWADGANVTRVGGDFGNQNYSGLTQVTTANVSKLGGAWLTHLEHGADTASQEATPIAIDGVLYIQTGQGDVFAVNGGTGKVIWEYKSGLPGVERGVAAGGGRIYAPVGEAHIVALNEKTGKKIWLKQVGTKGQDAASDGALTAWVTYYGGLVYTGTRRGGGPQIRAHVYALHAATGKLAWSFAATAGPGQPGHGTWEGSSWELGGGDVWQQAAVDPQLGLIYVTLANPQPRTVGGARKGADFYTNSIVALRWNTGKLTWWFQSVHHDLWDYDDEMAPVIADVKYGSTVRKVVIYGSKTGWLYYLDAANGKPVLKVHQKKVPQLKSQATSPTQTIPVGDSLVPTCPKAGTSTEVIPDYRKGCEFTPYLHQPLMETPGGNGGADWDMYSFDQKTGLLYVGVSEMDTALTDGLPYGQSTYFNPPGELSSGALDAVNPSTNTITWRRTTSYDESDGDGTMTTAGGLAFEGSPDGLLVARNASTGQVLWSWQTGTDIASTPISYEVSGVQYVAVFAGGDSNPYRSKLGDSLWAFKIGGTVPPAKAPAAIPARTPVLGPQVAGSAVADTVVLGRTWDVATKAPGKKENLSSLIAMAPPVMTVPTGTKVTFTNPSSNKKDHCAESYFDPMSFKIGPLAPGKSGSVTLTKPGDYFYNDCAGFPWDTGEIIVTS